jgi:hypothetical protein
MDDPYSSAIPTGPEDALIHSIDEPAFNMAYFTPIQAKEKRSIALVSGNQQTILPGSEETHVQKTAYVNELPPPKKPKLNYVKCSYCRRDKKPVGISCSSLSVSVTIEWNACHFPVILQPMRPP